MTAPLPLLAVEDLRVWFPVTRGVLSRTVGHVKAVDGVSLEVGRGETLGLVGESGCGKTTLGRAVLGLERPRTGRVLFRPENGPELDLLALDERGRRPWRRHLQMVFQDPAASLNPKLTVQDIVGEGPAFHGLVRGALEDAVAGWLREVGLDPALMHRYPHEFSGGQRQRIAIARAVALSPAFIVCDEAVSALDVSVQAQVINLLAELRERRGLSYLFISHDLKVVRHIAARVAVMYLGRVVESGPAAEVVADPWHPYAQALVSAVPVPGAPAGRRIVLAGDPPSPASPPPGCPFHPRCPRALPKCAAEFPAAFTRGARSACCHLLG